MKKSPPPEYPEIRAGQSIELLKALHILTRDGKMNQDSRRKLKQVYHLYQFIEPLLQSVWKEQGALTLVDHGAGKSYLGFILYDLFFKTLKDASHIYGIETREELVTHSCELARQLGLRRHVVPESVGGGFHRVGQAARQGGCGDGAARLRYRDGRCDPVRVEEAGRAHRAGAVLPSGSGGGVA